MISVLLAEDQGLMRTSLAALLSLEDDLQVTSVADGREALTTLRDGDFDVALLDIQMPHLTGLEVLTALTDEASPTRVVIVTTFSRPAYVRDAMDHGARGFLIKDRPIDELVDAIRRVAAGEVVIDATLAVQALAAPPNPLTAREIDVLRAAGNQPTIDAIAESLFLSHSTARNYLSSAIQKLGVANRAEARRLAEDNGWL